VPVLLGEFGAMNRTGNPDLTGDDLDLHLASRLYYHQLIVDTANSLGIAPFYWDNGDTDGGGSGIFNRISTTATEPDTVTALTGGPGLPGDFNDDGVVDAADYSIWRDHLGDGDETALSGSGDGMNGVDAGDYALWVDNFGKTLDAGAGAGGSAIAAVPEPASWLLVSLAALGMLVRRGPRRATTCG